VRVWPRYVHYQQGVRHTIPVVTLAALAPDELRASEEGHQPARPQEADVPDASAARRATLGWEA
jgi:hypothetical protein